MVDFLPSSMINLLRKVIPQWVINSFWHLPMAILANIIYGFPSRKQTVIGVTGTDGKTTTVNMIYQILKEASKKVSMVSTINAVIGTKVYDTGFHVTSPHPFDVQRYLKQAGNSDYMVMEVTSHGLDQHRFWGIKFDIGVITNITHEHLDYHQTWGDYFKTKVKLIKDVKVAILNRGEKHFGRLTRETPGKVVSFGLSKSADFNPTKFPLELKMVGEFNLLNGLAAAAVAVNLGINSSTIKQTLSNFAILAGRMQQVENDRGLKIFIDFAHTPNALQNALISLKNETRGQLIAVFGCAGERDETKRELMGEVSARLADKTVITAEDPRGKLDQINQQILQGAKKNGAVLGKNIFVENDRAKAIEFAISLAKSGDVVGIFGKGHETSMNLDSKNETPWSDREAVRKALSTKSENGQ